MCTALLCKVTMFKCRSRQEVTRASIHGCCKVGTVNCPLMPSTLGTCHAENTFAAAQRLLSCVPALVRYNSVSAPIRSSQHQHAILPSDRVASPGVVPNSLLCSQSLRPSPLRPSTFILSWSTVELSNICLWTENVQSCCA